MSSANTNTARYELLDPLRGVAILAVMLLHFSERGRESGDDLIHSYLWPITQHGYLGVQLFFVISGYCIAAALYGTLNKPQPFRYFMMRRFRRIFPPYWISIVLVVMLGFATIFILNTSPDVVFPLTPFDWLCNALLLQGPLHAVDANLVYWSLSIELQFYLVMAIALFWPKWTEAWLIMFSIVCLALNCFADWPLWGTVVVYWPEFLCGIVAYYWITGRMRWKWTPGYLVGIVIFQIVLQANQYEVLVQENGRLVQPIKLLFCLSCMATLLALRYYDQSIARWRSARCLAFFGIISYSLYLTHVPIGTRIFNLIDRLLGLDGLKWLACGLAAMVICTIFGWIFFRWFEKPWLNPPAPSPTTDTPKALPEGVAS
ncbi:acyltransferase 3 [Rhodopirellula maiorica SM1]|uniref:Acyltransferase 3 n=1 Tax=Rhodopirellula maiorica SM1 TaxID=1265738 RepID=M5RVC3_9BACT|nr:acyltransferase [Rhodopirellula maiorica]EMI17904.1 acyltransferase 3 [Rhodopirellula maiorica SM1]